MQAPLIYKVLYIDSQTNLVLWNQKQECLIEEK